MLSGSAPPQRRAATPGWPFRLLMKNPVSFAMAARPVAWLQALALRMALSLRESMPSLTCTRRSVDNCAISK